MSIPSNNGLPSFNQNDTLVKRLLNQIQASPLLEANVLKDCPRKSESELIDQTTLESTANQKKGLLMTNIMNKV